MLGFKQYLEERDNVTIEITADSGWLPQIGKANEDLEKVTAHPFLNSALFVNAVRGTLERYGILLPAHSNLQQLSMEGEVVYALGDSGHFVYVVHNLDPNGNVEGYAQIVDQDELDSLAVMDRLPDEEEPVDEANPLDAVNRMRKQVRRSNDDSGNTAEY